MCRPLHLDAGDKIAATWMDPTRHRSRWLHLRLLERDGHALRAERGQRRRGVQARLRPLLRECARAGSRHGLRQHAPGLRRVRARARGAREAAEAPGGALRGRFRHGALLAQQAQRPAMLGALAVPRAPRSLQAGVGIQDAAEGVRRLVRQLARHGCSAERVHRWELERHLRHPPGRHAAGQPSCWALLLNPLAVRRLPLRDQLFGLRTVLQPRDTRAAVVFEIL
mmetsp:Transcript_38183/g.110268  ORF Transcript_38183/g.110268 Transcript_38183/m.110268 type:complete len:225 (+) Transcript_38183:1269-1943(+)